MEINKTRTEPYRETKHAQLLVIITVLAFIQGCTVGPDYTPPDVPIPNTWHRPLTKGTAPGEADLRTWWQVFGDPMLEELIERSSSENLDLREALGRVREARALRRYATGQRYPDVDRVGSYTRSRMSENGNTVLPPGTTIEDTSLYSTGFDASWELDFFGQIRRSVEAATADVHASVENCRDILVTLHAEVAINYVETRLWQQQFEIAKANIAAQRRSLKLALDRVELGVSPTLDAAQAKSNLADTESEVPSIRANLVRTQNRLCVLLGSAPGSLDERLSQPGSIPVPPNEVTVGIPVDLIRRRPDIRRSERELAAQTARIGVAVADLYPRLSLNGSFSFDSQDAGDLFRSSSRSYGFGPSLRWNIFSAGRVRASIRVEDARTEQALVRYERTVLRALEEVENTLVAYREELERRNALHRAVQATRQSVELSQVLYRAGETNFQSVLDSQRSLLSFENRLANSESTLASNLISLYKALGGHPSEFPWVSVSRDSVKTTATDEVSP